MEKNKLCTTIKTHDFKNLDKNTHCSLCGKTVEEIMLNEIVPLPPKKILNNKPETIGILNYENKDNKNITVNINLEEIKPNFFNKFNLFKKKDSYILREISEGIYKLIETTGFKYVEKFKDSAYIPYSIIGKLNGLPFIMLKNKIPISLNLDVHSNLTDKDGNNYKNGIDLCYDAKGFYTSLDYIQLKNLEMKGQSFDLGEWFKNNWIFIVLALIVSIGIGIFLFLTPQGKHFLAEMLPPLTKN